MTAGTRAVPVSGRARFGAPALTAALAALVGIATLSALIAADALDADDTDAFALALVLIPCALAISFLVALRSERAQPTRLGLWPLVLAIPLWMATFVLRALTLWGSPRFAADPLHALGFGPGDLTRTVAMGGLGIACWCLGHLGLLLLPARRRRAVPAFLRRTAEPGRWRWALLIGAGTALWAALFQRQGGIDALINAPATIRQNQQSSFYGFIGVWMVQGAAVFLWIQVLRASSGVREAIGSRAGRVCALAFAIGVVAGFCLQLRELTLLLLLAMMIVYLHFRRPSRRVLAILLSGAVALGGVLLIYQQVRGFSQRVETSRAIELALRTPPAELASGDLNTFDNLVAMRELVPHSIGYLNGQTLIQIPGALVPRSIWGSKPQPIDQQVSGYLYPGGRQLRADGRAASLDGLSGTPILLQGELYWNLGLGGVAIGSLLFGALIGAVARAARRADESDALLALYSVTASFVPLLLTRALATMTGNLVLALIGTSIALLVLGTGRSMETRS